MINAVRDSGGRHWYVKGAPMTEPITVGELKEFARVDGDWDNRMLSGFITTARVAAEGFLGRALPQQTIVLAMDVWPGEVLRLPRPPLVSVTEVRTLDESNAATGYAASNYYVLTNKVPGEIVLKFGVAPPYNRDRYYSGYEVEYVAGYSPVVGDVPQPIRDALLIWATALYEGRVVGTEPPSDAKKLLDLHKVVRV